MSEKKSEASISELISAIDGQIALMTVAEIAEQTGKSERAIKAYLTRNGLTIKDYDGAVKKSNVIKEEPDNRTQTEVSAVSHTLTAYEAMSSIESDSRSRWSALGWVFAIIWAVMTFWGFSANGLGFFLFWIVLSFALAIAWMMTAGSVDDAAKKQKLNSMSPGAKDTYLQMEKDIRDRQNKIMEEFRHESQYGGKNPNLVCPHCQTKGLVRNKAAEEITSTKIVPVVGNTIKARKKVTQMHCDNCNTTWNI